MKPLTKSLHTVTAVSRVAKHIDDLHPVRMKPDELVRRALRVLGHEAPKDDPTVAACIAAYKRLK